MNRHNQKVALAEKGDIDLLMIGDSITHGWEGSGKKVWDHYYGDRKALNLGFSGDQTQHVLWRLDNGEVKDLDPKLAVIMIGTNNASRYTSEEIAAGVKAIVENLQEKFPKMKIVVLSIFPRGVDDNDARRKTNMGANKLIDKFADGKKVFVLSINDKFLDDKRILQRTVMPDLLHPKEPGYKIWAAAVEPTVSKLLGDEAKKPMK